MKSKGSLPICEHRKETMTRIVIRYHILNKVDSQGQSIIFQAKQHYCTSVIGRFNGPKLMSSSKKKRGYKVDLVAQHCFSSCILLWEDHSCQFRIKMGIGIYWYGMYIITTNPNQGREWNQRIWIELSRKSGRRNSIFYKHKQSLLCVYIGRFNFQALLQKTD